MLKKTVLTLTVLFLFIAAKGQENNSRFSIEISAGPSFPIGRFVSKDTSNYSALRPTSSPVAGWANTGIGLNISAGYCLNKSFKLMLTLGGQQNKQDEATLKKTLHKPYIVNDSIVGNSQSWKIGKIMAGGSFAVPVSVSQKLFFQLKVVAGICKTAVPGYKYAIFDTDASGTLGSPSLVGGGERSKTSLPWTFCYQISGGLKYLLTQKLSLFSDVSYFDASPVHKYNYYPNFPYTNPKVPSKKQYKLTSINPTVGVTLEL